MAIVSVTTRTVLVAVCVAACASGSAFAHDHDPPRVVLRTAGVRQLGHAYSLEWVSAHGNLCEQMHVDGVPLIPKKGLPLRPGRRIHVRFWKRQRPQHLSIHGYPRVDSEGGLTGRPRRLSYRLRRKVWAGGGHIWIATLRAPRFDHVYLDLFVRWRDEENCGGAQSMAMVWHLRNGADSS